VQNADERKYCRPAALCGRGSPDTGTYGTDVNTPVPQAEENNPNFKREACVVTKA
jgi:hypothetical protein